MIDTAGSEAVDCGCVADGRLPWSQCAWPQKERPMKRPLVFFASLALVAIILFGCGSPSQPMKPAANSNTTEGGEKGTEKNGGKGTDEAQKPKGPFKLGDLIESFDP